MKKVTALVLSLIMTLSLALPASAVLDADYNVPTILIRGDGTDIVNAEGEMIWPVAIGDEEVITCRPADLIEPELDKYRAEYADITKSDEDVLSCALFPQVAPKFLAERDKPAEPENAVRELFVEDLGN